MLQLISIILQALWWIVFIDVVLSWIMPGKQDEFPRNLTRQVTDPLYAPIHVVLNPQKIGFDLSPIIILILIRVMQSMLDKAVL